MNVGKKKKKPKTFHMYNANFVVFTHSVESHPLSGGVIMPSVFLYTVPMHYEGEKGNF